MKKILAISFVVLAISASPLLAAQRVYYGVPALTEGQDGQLWTLEQDNQRTAVLGASTTFSKKVQECLAEAAGLDQVIKFSGTWEQKEYSTELKPETAQCSQITKKAACPQKVLRAVTIEAIYTGVVCGDFCHLCLQPENGDEFSVLADEEKIEKLFGASQAKKYALPIQLKWNGCRIILKTPIARKAPALFHPFLNQAS